VPRSWDAAAYHRLSDWQEREGVALIDRLERHPCVTALANALASGSLGFGIGRWLGPRSLATRLPLDGGRKGRAQLVRTRTLHPNRWIEVLTFVPFGEHVSVVSPLSQQVPQRGFEGVHVGLQGGSACQPAVSVIVTDTHGCSCAGRAATSVIGINGWASSP
jgi:hypothetical protein